ncbi:MAG: hypothetical protein ACJAZ4_000450 [Neptuniibacter pectenicola]|jgi:hypothetical protein
MLLRGNARQHRLPRRAWETGRNSGSPRSHAPAWECTPVSATTQSVGVRSRFRFTSFPCSCVGMHVSISYHAERGSQVKIQVRLVPLLLRGNARQHQLLRRAWQLGRDSGSPRSHAPASECTSVSATTQSVGVRSRFRFTSFRCSCVGMQVSIGYHAERGSEVVCECLR